MTIIKYLKDKLSRINFRLSIIGINPYLFYLSIKGLPFYIRDWFKFKKKFVGKMVIAPCLNDRFDQGGDVKSEYFWQDLLVAQWIHDDSPKKHVDIGSRIDGFVSHLATFREVEVFDIRPIKANVRNIIFNQADITNENFFHKYKDNYCDSVSCLHSIEHFGLGRYGDRIDSSGFLLGIKNMIKLLQDKGNFYLSTPVGKERVEFNANWVFNPKRILKIFNDEGLSLEKLTIFNNQSELEELKINEESLDRLSYENYNLAIFKFIKIKNTITSNSI